MRTAERRSENGRTWGMRTRQNRYHLGLGGGGEHRPELVGGRHRAVDVWVQEGVVDVRDQSASAVVCWRVEGEYTAIPRLSSIEIKNL